MIVVAATILRRPELAKEEPRILCL